MLIPAGSQTISGGKKEKESKYVQGKSLREAVFADLVRAAEDPGTPFEEIDSHIRYLMGSSIANHDWKEIDGLISGRAEFLDALNFPMKSEKANRTPISELETFGQTFKFPNWIAAYGKIFLAHKDIRKAYVADNAAKVENDNGLCAIMDRLSVSDCAPKTTRTIGDGFSIKLLSEAIDLLELEVRRNQHDITKTPAFFLLLATYETFHEYGYRPGAFRKGTASTCTYLDLVQAMLERYPSDRYPEVYEYLADFHFGNAEANYLTSLMSRIEYEGDMERMEFRGAARQRTVDALMRRISANTEKIEDGKV